MIGFGGFVDGPVNLLGRLPADARDFCQFFRTRRHHFFEGSEAIEKMLGAFSTDSGKAG